MKPSSDEMQQAMEMAKLMRETDGDPHFLSKSLIYMNHRIEMLEKVYEAASHYMRFGQAEHEHAQLLQALEAARVAEDKESQHEDHGLGL